ncbi:MAG: hypothetical protein A4E43_00943 [Methanosaeta sp. PtaB.Bin005]|nr:MAG: hypothetical protein A4E43_00943 [Methanosaeta sp. PtaB.Bin005]
MYSPKKSPDRAEKMSGLLNLDQSSLRESKVMRLPERSAMSRNIMAMVLSRISAAW